MVMELKIWKVYAFVTDLENYRDFPSFNNAFVLSLILICGCHGFSPVAHCIIYLLYCTEQQQNNVLRLVYSKYFFFKYEWIFVTGIEIHIRAINQMR